MINHKCVNCGKIYEDASEEILNGCICGAKLFYFVKSSESSLEKSSGEFKNSKILASRDDKSDFISINDEEEFVYQYDEENKELIVFDVESISVLEKGKYTIDIEGLMKSKSDNLVYKYEDGKYGVDIDACLKKTKKKQTSRKKSLAKYADIQNV